MGFGTLVRPETPLLLFAAGLVLAIKWWRPVDWLKLLRAGLLLGVGVILPLVPWAARNWRTLHDVQFLAPRYSELPGEYTPLGFNAWTNTWLWHFRDVYLTQWKLNVEEISIDDIPTSAFDSPAERERVSDLLDQHNEELTIGPQLDEQFREIARERTQRRPLRTYVKIPFLRALTLWFTPRVEMMGYTGDLWPMHQSYEDDPAGFYATVLLGAIGIIYVALAVGGTARIFGKHLTDCPQMWGVAILIAYCVVRTTFLTREQTPEPRYVLECFPVVYALGAFLWARRADSSNSLM